MIDDRRSLSAPRFIGVFGIYHALQYLSLSDSIVLTLLTPLCTAIGGLIFLRENFSEEEAFAGSCVYLPSLFTLNKMLTFFSFQSSV